MKYSRSALGKLLGFGLLFLAVGYLLFRLAITFLIPSIVDRYVDRLNSPSALDAAVKYYYDPLYTDLASLRRDYPNYRPTIARWSDEMSFLLGFGKVSIQLPEALVLVDIHGRPVASRQCGSVEGDCVVQPALHPELGVVGMLYYGDDKPFTEFTIEWLGADGGDIYVRANCFWAHSTNAGAKLRIRATSKRIASLEFSNMQGYFQITGHLRKEEPDQKQVASVWHSSKRISREEFVTRAECAGSVN